jgi:hypothetical protein
MTARIAAVGLVIGVALASGRAQAGACTSAPLTTYLAGGSNATCTVGDATFSNMQYAETGSMPLLAADIAVTPDVVAGDPGLTFSGDFAIPAAKKTKDALINFDVSATEGFTDATVTLVGSTGTDGSYSDTLDLFTTGLPPSFVGGLEVTNTSPTDTIDFASQGTLAADDDLLLTGVEDLSQVTKQFSEDTLPEPGSLFLLGAGLTGLGLYLRRRAPIAMRAGFGGV